MVTTPKKDCNKRKTRPLAMTYVLGSFFGAFMIASAFAYFNFKFSQYKFIDFSQITFFQKRNLFTPSANKYLLVIYSTRATKNIQQLTKNSKYPILAIDINQQPNDSNSTFIHLKGSINSILQVVQRFNIYTVPSVVVIEKNKNTLYKQDSAITILDL